MFGDLFVVLKAKIAGFVNRLKEMIGITKGATNQINGEAKKMQDAFNSAFGGDLRNNIANLTENITEQKNEIIALESQVRELTRQQSRYAQGSAEYDKIASKIKTLNQRIREQRVDLAASNAELSRQKKALADSRLAAEDNSAAIEATSRAVNAASSAILLLGNNNEDLKPILKGVSTALALINAAVVIQNLRLRENAVLTNLVTRAKNLYTTATTGATAATTAFKTALTLTGIGAAIVALGYLASKLGDVSSEAEEAEKRMKRFKNRLDDSNDFIEEQIKAVERQVEIEQKQARLAGKTDNEILKIKQNGYDKQIAILKNFQSEIQRQGEKVFKTEIKNGASLSVAQEKRRLFEKETAKKISDEILDIENKKTNALLDFSIQQKNIADKANKQKVAEKPSKQIISTLKDQEKAQIESIKLGEQLLLKQSQTEEEKAKIINDAEQRILNIREFFAIETFKQNLLFVGSAEKLNADLNDINADRAESETKLNEKLKNIREKGIKENEQEQIAAQKNVLEKIKNQFNQQDALIAQQFADNIITEEQYNALSLANLDKYLKRKLFYYKLFGKDVGEIEKQIAENRINQEKSNNEKSIQNAEELGRNINRVILSSTRSLINSIVNLAYTSLERAFIGISEASQLELDILKLQQKDLEAVMKDGSRSQIEILTARRQYLENEKKLQEASLTGFQQLFRGALEAIADFLQQLGSGLIAAAVASEAFQKTLLTKPQLAIAAGAAAIVAGAAVRATLARGPKFANGGIVSGPTLGLVGEYPGASTNPEVIAPLDKLKSLIGSNGTESGFIAETRISGRDLAIVLNRYNKDLQRG